MLVLLVALVDDDVEVEDVLDDVGDLVDDEVEVEDGPGEEQHREDDLSHLGGITGGSKLFSRKKKITSSSLSAQAGRPLFLRNWKHWRHHCMCEETKSPGDNNTDCRCCNKEEAEGD